MSSVTPILIEPEPSDDDSLALTNAYQEITVNENGVVKKVRVPLLATSSNATVVSNNTTVRGPQSLIPHFKASLAQAGTSSANSIIRFPVSSSLPIQFKNSTQILRLSAPFQVTSNAAVHTPGISSLPIKLSTSSKAAVVSHNTTVRFPQSSIALFKCLPSQTGTSSANSNVRFPATSSRQFVNPCRVIHLSTPATVCKSMPTSPQTATVATQNMLAKLRVVSQTAVSSTNSNVSPPAVSSLPRQLKNSRKIIPAPVTTSNNMLTVFNNSLISQSQGATSKSINVIQVKQGVPMITSLNSLIPAKISSCLSMLKSSPTGLNKTTPLVYPTPTAQSIATQEKKSSGFIYRNNVISPGMTVIVPKHTIQHNSHEVTNTTRSVSTIPISLAQPRGKTSLISNPAVSTMKTNVVVSKQTIPSSQSSNRVVPVKLGLDFSKAQRIFGNVVINLPTTVNIPRETMPCLPVTSSLSGTVSVVSAESITSTARPLFVVKNMHQYDTSICQPSTSTQPTVLTSVSQPGLISSCNDSHEVPQQVRQRLNYILLQTFKQFEKRQIDVVRELTNDMAMWKDQSSDVNSVIKRTETHPKLQKRLPEIKQEEPTNHAEDQTKHNQKSELDLMLDSVSVYHEKVLNINSQGVLLGKAGLKRKTTCNECSGLRYAASCTSERLKTRRLLMKYSKKFPRLKSFLLRAPKLKLNNNVVNLSTHDIVKGSVVKKKKVKPQNNKAPAVSTLHRYVIVKSRFETFLLPSDGNLKKPAMVVENSTSASASTSVNVRLIKDWCTNEMAKIVDWKTVLPRIAALSQTIMVETSAVPEQTLSVQKEMVHSEPVKKSQSTDDCAPTPSAERQIVLNPDSAVQTVLVQKEVFNLEAIKRSLSTDDCAPTKRLKTSIDEQTVLNTDSPQQKENQETKQLPSDQKQDVKRDNASSSRIQELRNRLQQTQQAMEGTRNLLAKSKDVLREFDAEMT